jgi:signal transduction histidine kinase
LIGRTESRITASLHEVTTAQQDAGTAIDLALVGAMILAVASLFGLRYLFALPLSRFLRQIRAVAGGDYAAPIDARGAQEFQIIADAVDQMRASIIRTAADAAAVQQRLMVREERDRLAADLHDRTIQHMFGLGMALESMSNHGRAGESKDLRPLVEETDHIIRELQSVIFAIAGDPGSEGLRASIMSLVSDSRRALGFLPELTLDGPIDIVVPEHVAYELVAVLREALSNIARHADATQVTVQVAYENAEIHAVITDNGRGVPANRDGGHGIRNLHARAARLNGSASVEPAAEGGTVVRWVVPLPTAT